MRLVKATITNFRGISDAVTVKFGKLNVVVGQNDVGKSTLLKALNLFLSRESPQPEDANITTGSSEVTIELFFDPGDVTIDIGGSKTTFEGKNLINADKLLQIKRCWDASKSKLTATSIVVAGETEPRQLFPSSISGSKQILDAINAVLPRFEYFRADASLSETDTAIQNYFRDIAKQVIKDYDIEKLEVAIKKELKDVLGKITDKINVVLAHDDQVEPLVIFDWSKVVKTAFSTRKAPDAVPDAVPVPFDQRGDGFRRITMMAYFEHLAELPTDADTQRKIIFGFEEPETFLHPSTQEKLFERLSDLSNNNYQVILSTHSPVLVSRSRKEDLIHVVRDKGAFTIIQDIKDVSDIARDLGITGDNQLIVDGAKVLLLVEGPDDVNAMRHIAEIYKLAGEIPATFDELDIAIIPLGGCHSIQHWVNLRVLQRLNKPYCIYFDSDKGSATSTSSNEEELVRIGLKSGRDFLVTRKRAIENYIPCAYLEDILRRVSSASASLSYDDWDNVKKICSSHPHSGVLGGKNVTEKYFKTLSFAALRSSFDPTGNDDEFLQLYRMVKKKLDEPACTS